MPKPSPREQAKRHAYLASIDPRLRVARQHNAFLRDAGAAAAERDRERRHDGGPEAYHDRIGADPTSCPVCIVRKGRALRGLAETEDQIVDTPIITQMREAIANMKAANDAKEDDGDR